MITIIRKLSPDDAEQNYTVEVIDGERGIRSMVAEIKDCFICEEHLTAREVAECIEAAISAKLAEKFKE